MKLDSTDQVLIKEFLFSPVGKRFMDYLKAQKPTVDLDKEVLDYSSIALKSARQRGWEEACEQMLKAVNTNDIAVEEVGFINNTKD